MMCDGVLVCCRRDRARCQFRPRACRVCGSVWGSGSQCWSEAPNSDPIGIGSSPQRKASGGAPTLKFGSDSIRLRVQFKFSDEAHSGDSGYQKLKEFDLLSGGFDRSLQDVAFALCARLAILHGKPDLAKTWLQKMKETAPNEQRLLEKL